MDPELDVLLDEAGLRYTSDAEAGYSRRRAGRGFTYRMPSGSPLTDERALARIKRLVIPPAWTDVWICRYATGHLQATGRDARGRKQYRYHDEWRRVRDENKFDDLAEFGAALGDLRRTVDDDLARPGLPREKVVALVIALLDQTLIRVGNEAYRRDNKTFGLTTLYRKHVTVDGSLVRFRFAGKGGIVHEVRLSDRRLASLVRRCHELGGREVFSYEHDGEVVRVDSSDCNDYLHRVVGDGATVKTFRTWGGSVVALEALAELAADGSDDGIAPTERDVLEAIDLAAERLGNTRAVARRSYVHPIVPDAYLDGRLADAWSSSRTTPDLSRAERAFLRLLG
jgi:DNA topoisomerase I